jgi:predicted RNase H-like HicB family nuclease
MSYIINCPDGVTVKGETHEELLANAEAHIRDAHPDLVGKVSREELLSQAVTV